MKKIILFIGAIVPPQDDIMIISAPALSMEPYRTVVTELSATEIKEAIEQYTHPGYRPNYDQRRQRLMAGHPHKIYWHRIRSNPG